MSDSALTSKGGYFIEEAGAAAFNTAFTHMLAKLQKEVVSKYMSPENTHRFRHGGDWSHPGVPEAIDGGMQTHSAVVETRFQDLIDNDLDAIDRSARHLIEEMHQQFVQMLYLTVTAACDQTGNTVDAQAEGSLPEAFIAMMEKIEFVADKNGNVTLPQIHANPETATRMMVELETAPSEYKERVEAIKARKTIEAIEREAERKAKFTRYGDSCHCRM
ncbi:MAG: hypothetical protein PHD37_15680 [Gallionellaceae bacterium]|nr:hypothetical protein [Gallionellaceae bacterium]